ALFRASRDTSQPKMIPTWPKATSAVSVEKSPPVKLPPNWEPLSSSGVGCGLWEGEADVTVVQPIDVLVIAANTGQSRQAGRAIGTPTHAVMLLPVGNQQVVGFFDGIARDAQTKLLT